jgi:hypothetical protein
VDAGTAINVGGPVHVDHKTFEIHCPPELEFWLMHGKGREKSIQGVEIMFDYVGKKSPPSLDMGTQSV